MFKPGLQSQTDFQKSSSKKTKTLKSLHVIALHYLFKVFQCLNLFFGFNIFTLLTEKTIFLHSSCPVSVIID